MLFWSIVVLSGQLCFFVGYFVARRRKVLLVRRDADMQLLDDVLKLDKALYHEHDWLDHKDEQSPHVGLWLYRDDDGLVHVDNRFHARTNDDNRTHGATAGEALARLFEILKSRAEIRIKTLRASSPRGKH
jgi:hypothetical protein